jgi:hypothetical protein
MFENDDLLVYSKLLYQKSNRHIQNTKVCAFRMFVL